MRAALIYFRIGVNSPWAAKPGVYNYELFSLALQGRTPAEKLAGVVCRFLTALVLLTSIRAA